MSDELLALLMSAAGGNDQHVAALAAARIRELEAERDALAAAMPSEGADRERS